MNEQRDINDLIIEMRKDYKKSIDFYKELVLRDVYILLNKDRTVLELVNEQNVSNVDFNKDVDLFVYKTKELMFIPVFMSLEDLKKSKQLKKYTKINFLQFISNRATFDIEINSFSDTATYLPRKLLNDLIDSKFFQLNFLKSSLSYLLEELIMKEVEDGVYKNEKKESLKMKECFFKELVKSKVFIFLKNDANNNNSMLSLVDSNEPIIPCFLTVEDVLKSNIQEQFIEFPFKDLAKEIAFKSNNRIIINPFSDNKKILDLDDIKNINKNH